MQKCPVCENVVKDENQNYCLVCAWEFEYYFDDLSAEEKDRHTKRVEISKFIYKKSIDETEIKSLYKKIQELEKKCAENKKDDSKYLLLDENKKSDVTLKFLNKSMIYFIWNSFTTLFLISILLIAFTAFMVFTFDIGEYNNIVIMNLLLVLEGIFFLWVIKRDFKRLLIEKKLVKSDEKSPILYFIGSWIGFLIYIPLEILKYILNKVTK